MVKPLNLIVKKIKELSLVNTSKNKSLVKFICFIAFFFFIFFSCMLSFIDHSNKCFNKDGNISKENNDFVITGNIMASLGLITTIVIFIVCIIILYNFSDFLKKLEEIHT